MPAQLAGIAALEGGDPAALAQAAARLARTARELGLPRLAEACDRLAVAPPGTLDERLRDTQAMLRTGIDDLRAWRPEGWNNTRSNGLT
jgi:hypothetical protein